MPIENWGGGGGFYSFANPLAADLWLLFCNPDLSRSVFRKSVKTAKDLMRKR